MSDTSINRRTFIQAATVAGAGVVASQGIDSKKALAADELDHRNERPDKMTYRKLGRTNFMCSRLVFGCGAALAGGKAVRLLERAFAAGINHYDVGYDDYYKGSEKNLAAFMKRHREELWITSKAPARTTPGSTFNSEEAKNAATYWTGQLEKSLSRLDTDYVDAYYVMGVSNPDLLKADEIGNAFMAAKEAGKVGHFGISTHTNAQECLEAAVEMGWYDLAMIAITPAGWYDYGARELVASKGTLKQLRPVLDKAREAGVGLVGMKAARYIAVTPYGGKYGKVADESIVNAFDELYDDSLLKADLSPYQRSYAYVLENGLDVVNADMQNFRHFEENLFATTKSETLLA